MPPMNYLHEKYRKNRYTTARRAKAGKRAGKQETARPRHQTAATAAAVVYKTTNDVVCWSSDARHRIQTNRTQYAKTTHYLMAF